MLKPGVQQIKMSPKRAQNCEWCRIVDAFQTSAIAADNDYKLKHLVKVFGLSGDLLERLKSS
jgi:hypothetical protein